MTFLELEVTWLIFIQYRNDAGGKILLPSDCVYLSRTLTANCNLSVVQFDKCNLGYRLLIPVS